MPSMQQRLVRAVVVGFLARVPQGFVLYLMSDLGLFVAMGVALNVPLNLLYSTKHLVLGALFGTLFVVPVLTSWSNTLRGIVIGLCSATVSLFIINPFFDGVGFLGLDLGPLMPVVSIVANVIWGVIAGVGIDLWNRVTAAPEEEE